MTAISVQLLTQFGPNFFDPKIVKWTFVKATFDLATFVHISNISAVNDPIMIKLLGPLTDVKCHGNKALCTLH